jgi:ATPase family AAA domain-containing protein 3A/B
VTGFDPDALERAAAAARELDASRNATAAVDLIKVQEATKQHEAVAKRAEYEAASAQMRLQQTEIEGVEARKTLEAKGAHDKQRADYSDQLDRKRLVDQLSAQKEMQVQALQKQEELAERTEKMRRQTLEYEAELKMKGEAARVKAEAEGKIKQERTNHDLILEKLALEAAEKRKALVQSVTDATKMIGEGLSSFIDDKQKLQNTAATLTVVALGIYTAKVGTGVAGRFIEANLGKPSLVRDTSRITVSQILRSPLASISRIVGRTDATKALEGIVLEKNLSRQLEKVAVATSNTKKNRAPFRHLMLHGPPGTGKTMFAKNLAKNSGLEYAILTGGDVAPLGKDAVTEIHKLFDWAHTSRKGLMIFVDEADAFLRNRETEKISEDQRNALNAFLYRTGTESDKFMMVYATNKPSQFDSAITDRTDAMVEFALPSGEERLKMINMYMKKYLSEPPSTWSKKVAVDEAITEVEIANVAKQTEGWSGREISKLAIAWQSAAYGTDGAKLSLETYKDVVVQQSAGKTMKDMWLEEARAEKMARDAGK